METTFTCNATDHELERAKVRELRGYYWVLPFTALLAIFFLYLLIAGVIDLRSEDSLVAWQARIYSVVALLLFPFVLWLIHSKRQFYRHVREKTFTVDVKAKRFHYHDAERDATFCSDDILMWYVSSKDEYYRQRPPRTEKDRFVLKNGQSFYLEDAFNNEIHLFLVQHKQELSLPDPVTEVVKW